MNSFYFGVVFAMVVGLVANKIRNSALTRGDLTFKKAFVIFGLFGFLVFLCLSIYIFNFLMNTTDNNAIYFIIGTSSIPLAVYSMCVFLGLWRSSKKHNTIQKITARYFSIFYLSTSLASIAFSFFYFFVSALTYIMIIKLFNLKPMK